ncbi:hypothetical protein L1987_85918 [Smallanthus sonchifolius]|uniref:Uncharacterized protein n=1 Tax=Smallanthus sonchifolius TaxID=185202 RepID=A0ACB8XYN4_9ASTR|nr:hypothetical protein L1987_85918 [Smallanthus sonchifolius]
MELMEKEARAKDIKWRAEMDLLTSQIEALKLEMATSMKQIEDPVIDDSLEPETRTDSGVFAISDSSSQVPPPARHIFDFEDPDVEEHIQAYLRHDLQADRPADVERVVIFAVEDTLVPSVDEAVVAHFRAQEESLHIPSAEEVRQIDWSARFAEMEARWAEEGEVFDTPGPETLMDESVPPLVQQDVPIQTISALWADSDDELEFSSDTVTTEHPNDQIDEESEKARIEDDMTKEEEHVLSWEFEFGDELVGFTTQEADEVFDPVGDITTLESLLYGEPAAVIEQSPNREDEEEVMEMERPLLVEDEQTPSVGIADDDSRPVDDDDDYGSPSRSNVPRDGARERLDRRISRTQTWSIRGPAVVPDCRDDHAPHYMHGIQFGPGKFKSWWPDSSLF